MRSVSSLASILVVGLQLMDLFSSAYGQDAPLFVEGALEDAIAFDDTFNSGGTISVGGFNITIPKNLQVEFPAAYVGWRDFAAEKDSMIGYETMVLGNFINGVPIAAQVQIYEFFEGLASGFIESIDFEDASMKIRNGPTLRINDPNAVFSAGYTAAPFFTADDESPSITSFSGFPMCIPRNTTDPACPSSNRPFNGQGTFVAPDPLSMVPFLPGDFITWAGIRRGDEVIAFSIVAQNVQITTIQNLVYLRTEIALLGISNFNGNTELAESRIVGYTSNPRSTVAMYAMDIDPCTGAVTDRIVAAIGLRGGGNAQNKFEYRADILSGYARDYRIVAEINGVPTTRTTKNGFLAGTYVQPVNVWIQSEQDVPGVPPPANDFSQLPWLTEGLGLDEDGNLWGPLDPFPQSGVLIEPPACNVAKIQFEGDEVNTDWVPSASLLNATLPLNSTALNSTVAPAKRRNVPDGRWATRARLDATTLPAGDPALNQISA
ncbi:hypothetical protein F5B22DRAFT_642876 [Xylaria bambusicola]|uniref:uncharacterized protein n=1 Tax=Xylaria bambusicola TaxID=326684 RepID=UPI0020075B74|nr:uncharacterized protein F5B22DRAFT_642876 [Xylaria bambusicola]KAI0523775.1 hypothetical protein F5B22DRAFT_642876 [Xylaria bambusicola]